MQGLTIEENNFNEVVNHNDIQRITMSASFKYKTMIPKEEIDQAKNIGIWKAIKKYNSQGNIYTFEVLVFNYVKWECLGIIQKNIKHKNCYLTDDLIHTAQFSSIELDVKNIDGINGDICYDFLYQNYNISELSHKYQLSRFKISRILHKFLKKFL